MDKQQEKKKTSRIARLRELAITLLSFIFNPRLLLCFGIGWMITNGWAYIMLGLGTFLQSAWMVSISGFYLSLLWFPFTPEKLLSLAIAIWLMTRLFPNDKKTLAVLREEMKKAKQAIQNRKSRKKAAKTKQKKPEN
ncbi:MAG: hypothetical protein II359_05580 [Clostridia bacterium]|nr:hypothetical protein [Clostridia bacterium]